MEEIESIPNFDSDEKPRSVSLPMGGPYKVVPMSVLFGPDFAERQRQLRDELEEEQRRRSTLYAQNRDDQLFAE